MIGMTTKELFNYFQDNLICESLTLADVEKLSAYLQLKNFDSNTIISDMGEVGEFLAFIIEGKVKFTSGSGSEEAEVGKQGPGNLIGEMSFFDRKPRALRMAACKKGVKLLILTRAMYDRIKVEEPYIAVNILENAIVSLDHLVRHMGEDINALENYVHGFGKR
ncbi:Crp/Fnr family transcriptional regulator [Thiomicrorhabdus cannonii]|uniref:Crp/Fnr family transcriptional regulator n=1 Tax=Thiomicrorhabdus cannonii TaxID=2748011 RepID=UPI0015BEEE98|nr:cyclic nucleotide-binding domain-containing protein [Thiomicrorhabdus cannonii]